METPVLASMFESLGGGSLNANGWAFGCEFGFWQRSLGLEQMGLLRWASVAPDCLLRGLRDRFDGIERDIVLREHTDRDWGFVQTRYGIYGDHTGLDRAEVSADQAIVSIARKIGFLRQKLLTDLETGEKLFVYRTYDHTLSDSALDDLAAAVNFSGRATLFYVAADPARAFTAERRSPDLIVGYIDRFAPVGGRLEYNPDGWAAVCRAALAEW